MGSCKTEKMHEQLTAWRDSYVDLRIKNNNMLNQAVETSNAIVLETSGSFTYPMFWEIAMGRGSAEEYALQSKAVAVPGTNPIAWKTEREGISRNSEVLEDIVKRANKTIIQKGENPLCMTFGKLRWRVSVGAESASGEDGLAWIETPLVFIPIKLNQAKTNFWLKAVDEDAFINPALSLRYARETGRAFPLPPEGQWIDRDSFAIEKYFEEIAQRFDGVDFQFNPDYVALDVFDSERICMYRDVSRNFESLKNNKIIRAFFGERICVPQELKGLDAISPDTCFSVLDSNSSQSDVIERFNNGESFILEGPPGTGKTQTIVNMIAEAIMRNKKVLFVSGKMSALNTVQKKLQMPGASLDKHCLLIQCEKESAEISLADTYGKLRASLDAPRPVYNYDEYVDCKRNFSLARDILLGYNKEFYDTKNSLGVSIYDVIGRMLVLGYNENHVVQVNFDKSFVQNLTKEKLETCVEKIGNIERVLKSLLARSTSLEEDVWYGFRHDKLEPDTETAIRNSFAENGSILRKIAETFDEIIEKTDGEDVKTIIRELRKQPLDSLALLLDEALFTDIGSAYIKETLRPEKTSLQKEIDEAKKYAPYAKTYYEKTQGGATVETETLEKRLQGKDEFFDFTLKEVKAKLDNVQFIKSNLSSGILTNGNRLSANDIAKWMQGIERYKETLALNASIYAEVSQFYTNDLWALDYKKLLMKCRTDWNGKIKDNQSPLFFNMQIKPIKKCCKDVANADFSVRAVYELLEKIEQYHQTKETVKTLKEEFNRTGLSEIVENIQGLDAFYAFLKTYAEEKENHTVNSLLFEELSFGEYIRQKEEKLYALWSTATDLQVKQDMTVKQLNALVADYKVVALHNARIKGNEVLCGILPSLSKDVQADWEKLLALLTTIENVRSVIRDETRTIQEEFAVFTQALRTLTDAKLHTHIQALQRNYSAFYNNEQWFDKNVSMDVHFHKDMTFEDFTAWFEQISDMNHVTEYVGYRRMVKDLDVYGKQFFEQYVAFGRKEYPIDKMRDNYELSLLYAYYVELLEKSKYVARLSGKDGVTTVEEVINKFASLDKQLLEFNRKVVDMKVYNSIERVASRNDNLHGYLGSIPTGKSSSVRRLFKMRAKSIMQLAPCIMMSVYSVSKLLEYSQYQFDVVIFDEASQIPAEDALTSLMRAKSQVVIAGDPKQMPAISYFKSKDKAIGGLDEEDDMTCTSIIDFLIRAQDNTISYETLTMHYRSNHESLIKYSNEKPELYGGKLVTFPSPKAKNEDFGLWNYPVYEDERFKGKKLYCGAGENRAEAEIVVDLIRRHIQKYPLPKTKEEIERYNSLGVIVFGRKQKKLIENLLREDAELSVLISLNNPHVFMMATVDEVQGDEMSEMILSLTYGYNDKGELTNGWGHLNQLPVALYKFNVAVTRARNNLKFVHSIKTGEIGSPNLNYVVEYLRQFETGSRESFENHTEYNTRFVEAIGAICESVVGKERVVYNYGESVRSYRVPIGILAKDGQSILLGVMCEINRGKFGSDGAQGAQSGQGFSVKEYAHSCNEILKAHDWNHLYTTYAIQWIRNYAHEKKKLLEELQKFVEQ